ncbi:MAG: hypothetical protein JO138_04990 [Acidobacteriaceae bacterium]|nr:hypothetical protein [Acidobacteriaceae bacterium]
MHEYTHFIVERAGLHIPRWLNEGLADLYSSLETDGSRTLLGMPLEDRMLILKTRPWIDLASLVSATDGSPYFHDHEQMLIVYSQSWLLAHMLALSPAYAGRFPEFLSAINRGRSALDCFESVYGRTVEQVSADLLDYFRGRLPVYSYPLDLTNIRGEAAVSPLSQRDLELTLAGLLAVNPDQQGRAATMLRDISSRYPAEPEPEVALGYIALRQNSREKAREHFLTALERHSNDPDALYYGARLQETAPGAAPDQIIQLFQKVLALKPDHYEARLELGFFAAKNQRFALAGSVLADAQQLRPEHVYPVTYTLAYCQAQLGELDQARQSAQNARRSALNAKQVEQVNHLLRYIDQERRILAANTQRSAIAVTGGQ